MDIATLVGIFGCGILMIVVMMMAGNLLMFWDLVSVIIVIGGATFAALAKMSMDKLVPSLVAGTKAVFVSVDNPLDLINEVIELANTARKNSILALEKVEVKNKYLAKYVRYMVDGYDKDIINNIIDIDLKSLKDRHGICRSFYQNMTDGAPAFGMIGTVIGLVVIMADLTDIDKIGPGLAVALITTLYGASAANMLFSPLTAKLKYRTDEEVTNFKIIREGVNAIIGGENPRTIKQKLDSYLDPSILGAANKNKEAA
jgi:chemotaxis protein MotA